MASLLDLIPAEARRARVMPVLREHMQPFDLDPVMQRCMATLFGALVASVRGMRDLFQGMSWGLFGGRGPSVTLSFFLLFHAPDD